MRRLSSLLLLGEVALAGCVSKGDLQRIEDRMTMDRAEASRQDSARATQLREVIAMQQRIMDSLTAGDRAVRTAMMAAVQGLKGDLAGDLYDIQQQLVQVQALTGQSQQRLTELRTQLEARSEQLNAGRSGPRDSTITPGPAATTANAPSADQAYEASLQQLRRGSTGTARMGFREFLRLYPSESRVPDATYFVGESFAADAPDSAAVFYAQVAQNFPTSPRAATSLYKLGLLAERRKDVDAAKTYYQRVVKDYSKSDEAALARDRLKTIGR